MMKKPKNESPGKLGNSLWIVNYFKGNILTGFIDDLEKRKSLPGEDEVKKILDTLEKSVEAVKHYAIAEGKAHKATQNIHELFFKFSNIKGDDSVSVATRKRYIKAMKKQRKKLADAIRSDIKTVSGLAKEEATKLVNLFDDLSESESFKSLKKAKTKFEKKLKKVI